MDVCAAYHIPHSQFLAWDADDRDKAIWHHLRQREACPSCGTRPDEWRPEAGGHAEAYRAELRVCEGCKRVEQRQADTAKDQDLSARRGVHVALVKNPEVG